MFPRGASRALLAVTAGTAVAQFSDWQKGQISTEICTWEQPRAALIRDTIYLDGGTIWWVPTLNDGSTGRPVDNGSSPPISLMILVESNLQKEIIKVLFSATT